MKKLLFSISLLTGLTATAQLPNGSIAPDFTLTDIDGVSHNLYTYLDQGKTVFIDVSATWCGPCWAYHETGALEDLWVAHGPMGGNGVSANTTDDVIVLFIEGDGTTNNNDLHGTGGNTQGDWVTGVEHPIIDPASTTINAFNDDYAIGYFPTIYKICPNRIIEEIGQASASQLYASVADCPPPASNPVDAKPLASKGQSQICGPADYTPIVQIQNNGLDPLTDATVTITLNGNVVSTGTYSGSLSTYGIADVTCSVIAGFTGGDLVATVDAANDADVSNNALNIEVMGAVETTSKILFTITTDGYASEIGWNIKNANNQVVPGTTDPTLANNTTYNYTYNLSALGCYTLNMTDSYGDGLIGNGVINVRDENNVVLLNNEAYGEGISVPFKVISISTDAPVVTTTAQVNNGVVTACLGTTVTLSSSSTNGNSWSSGQTTQNITVTTAGTYTVSVNGVTSNAITVNFVDCAGIDEEAINNISVYPNPSKGVFLVSGADMYNYSEVQVLDNAGRIVASYKVAGAELSIDLTGVDSGIYTLLMKGADKTTVEKIQVMK